METRQSDSNDPVSMYLREVANIAPLGKEEEKVLWLQTQSPNAKQAELAKRQLIESRLSLVVDIAERHASSGLSMLDLIQEGNIGLLAAVSTFPTDPESEFPEHAGTCIERAIIDAIVDSQSKTER